MTIQITRKFGFFFSLVIMVGSLVGITIFFKNYQVFNAVGGDPNLVLVAWIMGAVVAFFTAMSYIDVARLKRGTKMPFAAWSRFFYSRRYEKFVATVALMYAYAIVLPTLYYYSYSFLVQALGGVPTLAGGLIALIVIPTGMFLLNIFAERGSAWLTRVLTFLKIIPLGLVALAGLFFTSSGGGFDGSLAAVPLQGTTPAAGLIFALPAVLFAFDGFLTVTNIAHKTKRPRKNIPLAMFFGMIFVTVLYLLVTISQINHNGATVGSALVNIFGSDTIARVTLFFISISAFGVSNIITLAAKITCTYLIERKMIPFSDFYLKLNKKHGTYLTGGLVMLFVSMFGGLLMLLIQAALINNGFIGSLQTKTFGNPESANVTLIIDEFSNYPTYFFYPLYFSIILAHCIALFRKRLPKWASPEDALEFRKYYRTVSSKRRKITYTISSISMIAILLSIGAYVFYNIIYLRLSLPAQLGRALTPDEALDVALFFINFGLFLIIPVFCWGTRKLELKYRRYRRNIKMLLKSLHRPSLN